jgi:pimeloyl-ACP methyl ester carboxylesterase
MLVAGRERPYLQAFFTARCFDPSAISEADLEIYASAYAAAGVMRAGFELYRTFDRDAEDNRAALERHGKLPMPVLAVGGASSTSGPLVEEMMREVAGDVTGLRVPGAAHWIPQENPQALVHAMLEFAGPATNG